MLTKVPRLRFMIRGGLGNQLFQAAAAAYYASQFNAFSLLDDVAIVRHGDMSRRSWIRKINLDCLFGEKRVSMTNLFTTRIRSLKKNSSQSKSLLSEKEVERLKFIEKEIFVYDWFQSKKFAPEIKPYSGSDLIHDISDDARGLFDNCMAQKNLAAIHIRLGDFRNSSWGSLPDVWYQNALEELCSHGIVNVNCFSDDLPEARNILKPFSGRLKFTYPELQNKLRPHELLFVLSGYQNFISSNSTLSWWASYLNRNLDAMIYTPWDSDHALNNWIYVG